jgi:hypothetical protein
MACGPLKTGKNQQKQASRGVRRSGNGLKAGFFATGAQKSP